MGFCSSWNVLRHHPGGSPKIHTLRWRMGTLASTSPSLTKKITLWSTLRRLSWWHQRTLMWFWDLNLSDDTSKNMMKREKSPFTTNKLSSKVKIGRKTKSQEWNLTLRPKYWGSRGARIMTFKSNTANLMIKLILRVMIKNWLVSVRLHLKGVKSEPFKCCWNMLSLRCSVGKRFTVKIALVRQTRMGNPTTIRTRSTINLIKVVAVVTNIETNN